MNTFSGPFERKLKSITLCLYTHAEEYISDSFGYIIPGEAPITEINQE